MTDIIHRLICVKYDFDPAAVDEAIHYIQDLRAHQGLMDKLLGSIRSWAEERGLLRESDARAQFIKLTEELGELAAALARHDRAKAIDAIGDMVVVLVILSEHLGVPLEDCIAAAYAEIKDRRGRMVNGMFVKES